MRTATSWTSSTAVPPAPHAMSGPKSGSLVTPASISTPSGDLSLEDEAIDVSAPPAAARRPSLRGGTHLLLAA